MTGGCQGRRGRSRRAAPVSVSLGTPGAGQPAGSLRFLSEWLTGGREQPVGSLARLIGSHSYGIGMLRHDLAR